MSEVKRDIGQEILEAIEEIKGGGGRRFSAEPSPVAQVRLKAGLTQVEFAALIGVSTRTLQEWEQGRRRPSGAAKTLLRIAAKHPEWLKEIAA